MAKRKPSVLDALYLDGAPTDDDLSPFAVPVGPSARRATGRKTMRRQKGDSERPLAAKPRKKSPSARSYAQSTANTLAGFTPGNMLSTGSRWGTAAGRYLREADDFGGDASTAWEVAKALPGAMWDAFNEDKLGFLADLIPGAGTVDAIQEGAQLRDEGRGAEAFFVERNAGPIEMLGLAPFGAIGAGVKAGAKGAARAAVDAAARRARRLPDGLDFAAPPVSRGIPRERVFSVTPEETPGASSQHRADITQGSLSARARYGAEAPWRAETPDGDAYDVLYAAQGIPQRPAEQAAGAYVNSQGKLEINPVNIFQPEVGIEPDEGALARIAATENLRGLIDAQEYMAGNMPIPDPEGAAAMLRMPSQPDYIRMARTARALGDTGAPYGLTSSSQGAVAFPFGRDRGVAPSFVPETSAMLDELMRIYPEAEIVPSRNVGFYEPALGTWDGPTAPYSGQATMQTLQNLADAPADVATGISSSPQARAVMRAKVARDEGAPGVRGDLQNTRRFFADANWQDAVYLIRRGVSPAAALAALGYSTSALASDGQ